MSDTIASAFVELRGDLSKFAADMSSGIEKAMASVNTEAAQAGEKIEAAFKEAAAAADVALDGIGGTDVFGDLNGEAARAGEQIEGSFREAATQADSQLEKIGGAEVWSDLTAEAERAGEKIEDSMKEAAVQSEAHLKGIDANAGGGMLSKAGLAVAGFGYLGGVAFRSVITNASDLGESLNAVNVTFGENAAGITKLGEEAATAVGLSQSQFNGLAVQFSSFATTIAGEGGNVVGTMDDMTTRAADFASVMNLEVADAAAIFQAGLAGETDGLKKFGIDLSSAAVEAYALSSGIWDGSDAMTNAEQVQARYGLLMESTAKTAGDFANTSDGLANSQRIMKANLADAAATIGTALLPILAELVTFFSTQVVPWLQENVPKAIDVLAAAFEGVRTAVQFVIEHFETFGPILAGVAAAIAGVLVVAFYGWATAAGAAAIATIAANAPIIAIGVAIAALVAGIIYAYTHWEAFRLAADAVVRWFRTVFLPAMERVWEAVVEGARALADFFVTTVWPMMQRVWDAIQVGAQALADFFVTHVWPVLQTVWDGIITGVTAVATFFTGTFLPGVQTVFAAVVTAVDTFWTKTDGLRGFLLDVFNAAVTVVVGVITTLWTAFSTAITWAQDLWTKTEGLRGFLADVFSAGVTVAKVAVDVLWTAFSTAITWAQDLWTKTEELRGFLANAFALGVGVAKLAIDLVAGAMALVFAAAQDVWTKTEGLRGFFAGAFSVAINIVKGAFDGVATALSAVWDWVQDVWDKTEGLRGFFAGAFTTAVGAIVGTIGTIGGAFNAVIGFLDSIISKARSAIEWLDRVIGRSATAKVGVGAFGGGAVGRSSGEYAYGTDFAPGGVALVGERGRELIELPRGSRVRTNSETEAILSRSAGGGGPLVAIASATFVGRTDADLVAQAMNAALIARG